MTRPTTFKLDVELAAAVDRLARDRGATRSQILREAVADYVARGPTAGRIDLGDLVGSLEGPGDLSTNRAYFEGFGASRPLAARAAPAGRRRRR